MDKPKRTIVRAALLVGYGLKKEVTPIVGTGKTHHVKTEWHATWKGEVIGTFPYKDVAIEFIRNKAAT